MATPESAVGARLAVGVFVLVLLASLGASRPPRAALPADAPLDQFSARRALAEWAALTDGLGPHPVGTPDNHRLRERIVARFEALGFRPRVQQAVACRKGNCAAVRNVVVRIEGRAPQGKAVALAAHYDSVPAGPGAGDDGSGVAILLETARLLSHVGPRQSSVVLLLTDGEESNLLGAQAFVDRDPTAGRIGALVNVEARGIGGRSILVETSSPNAWLIRHAGPRPFASSLFYEVYERMPNDTDLTVFKQAGIPGVNFAFVEGVHAYHTPLDDLKHLDPDTVQHQGDQALAMLEGLATGELDAPRGTDAVYTDVFGLFLVRWPEPWTPFMAVGALMALFGLAAVRWRRGELTLAELARAQLAWVALTLGAALAASLGDSLLGWFGGAWTAIPGPYVIGAWLCVCSLPLLGLPVLRRLGPGPLQTSCWTPYALGGVLLSWLVPGASYLFLIPLVVMVFCDWACHFWKAAPAVLAPLIGAAAALSLWLPLALQLPSALSLSGLIVAVPLTLGILPLLPVLAAGGGSWRLGAAPLTLGCLALGATLFLPEYTAEHPERANVSHVQRGTRAWWQGPASLDWTALPAGAGLPLDLGGVSSVAPARRAEPPRVEVVEDHRQGDRRELRLRVSSRDDGIGMIVGLPLDRAVERLLVEGVTASLQPRWGLSALVVHGELARGVTLDLTLRATERFRLTLAEFRPGVPDGGPRRSSVQTQSQWGDLSLLVTELEL